MAFVGMKKLISFLLCGEVDTSWLIGDNADDGSAYAGYLASLLIVVRWQRLSV